ncbi:hypothetical protein L0222_29230 [bacterium]|nr:hypothetical protein [bacterium]MCI0601661.1 hypothetical protein [bacterium]
MADRSFSDFAKNLERGSKALQMYSESHPTTKRTVQETYQSVLTLLENRPCVTVSVLDGQLLVEGEIVEKGNMVLDRLAHELVERNIYNLRILRGLKMEEMIWLLQSLILWPQRIRDLGGFEKIVADSGIQTIQANLDLYTEEYSHQGGSEEPAAPQIEETATAETVNQESLIEIVPELPVVTPPSISEELLKKETLAAADIEKIPESLHELINQGKLQEADHLSKKAFSCLGSGQPDQKKAVIESLPAIIRALSRNEKWKNVEFSLSFLISTYYRKEASETVLQFYIPFLVAMFVKSYESKNWPGCQDVLSTIRIQTEHHDSVRQEFADAWIKIAGAFIEHLRGGWNGVEVVLEGFKIAAEKGISYLVEVLADEEDQKVRSRLIGFVTMFRPDVVLIELEKRMSDPRWYVVRNMVTIFSKIPYTELPDFFRVAAMHPEPRVSKELLKVLYKGTAKSPLSLLLMEHPDKNVRIQAVHLVTMQANVEAVPALLKTVTTIEAGELDLRTACWQALLKLRVLDAVAPAAMLLDRKASSKAETAERNAAVRILGELAREQTRSVLQRTAQSDQNPETRALAASYL